jgi:hypothetical protein
MTRLFLPTVCVGIVISLHSPSQRPRPPIRQLRNQPRLPFLFAQASTRRSPYQLKRCKPSSVLTNDGLSIEATRLQSA